MKRRTRDWKYIDVKDMETSHIENCIKHIKQHWIFQVRWYAMWTEIDWDVEEDFEAEEERLKIFNDELQRRKETWKDAEIRRLKQKVIHRKVKFDEKQAQYRADTKDLKEKIKQQAHAMNKMQKEIKDLKDRINTAVMFCDMFAEWDKLKDQVDEALKKFIS